MIFNCFGIQVSDLHCNYLLEFCSTLAIDLFFWRELGGTSADQMEMIVKDCRATIANRTTGMKNFGVRKQKFRSVNIPFLKTQEEDKSFKTQFFFERQF